MRRSVLLVAFAGAASAFLPAPALPSTQARRHVGATEGVQMQLFGRKPTPPPAKAGGDQQGLPPRPGQTVVTWMPSGIQSYARPGQRLGDAAQQAGLNIPYGCKEGVCGTCEAFMSQPTGQKNEVRICRDIVPKTNLDAPDREKMWGDLRGGKKSIGELKGVPLEITVTLSNPGLALKRQQSWEQVKESAAKNTKDWLDPNYKGPGGGAAPQKKGWNPFGR
jgi:ferredoxin